MTLAKIDKKIIPIFILMFILTLFLAESVGAITAEEIIGKRDSNEFFDTAKMEAEMIIINGNRKLTKAMVSYTDGDNSLTEFTNPRDRGSKFLKKDDDLWMFFPEAEDVVKISGHMLNQGMMGSDFSYQDLMESNVLIELYDFELIGEEEVEGRSVYLLEGTAVEEKEVSYYRRKIWIDKERFVGLKEELYARSGRLLKIMKVNQVKEFEGRWYPMVTVMEDQLKEDTQTRVKVKSIEFDPEIPEGTFTLENLQ